MKPVSEATDHDNPTRGRGYDETDVGRQRRERTPPGFWESLSRVPFCRRSLREFDRRTIYKAWPERPERIALGDNLTKRLQAFALRGGPDCQDIIAYPATHLSTDHTIETDSSSSMSSIMHPFPISLFDPAFQQCVADHNILMPTFDETQCTNLQNLRRKVNKRRPSLSPSEYPYEKFAEFQNINAEVSEEFDVYVKVVPLLNGSHTQMLKRRFPNLESMTDGKTTMPKPDIYEGSLPVELDRAVREDLNMFIVPSHHQHEPLLPNHFTEVKGVLGSQITVLYRAIYDAAHGCRAMHQVLSYGKNEQQYDGRARSFASTYDPVNGVLHLYASYAVAPAKPGGPPTYCMVSIGAFLMTTDYKSHRAGLNAYRNLQDLAKKERTLAIAYANRVDKLRHRD